MKILQDSLLENLSIMNTRKLISHKHNTTKIVLAQHGQNKSNLILLIEIKNLSQESLTKQKEV